MEFTDNAKKLFEEIESAKSEAIAKVEKELEESFRSWKKEVLKKTDLAIQKKKEAVASEKVRFENKLTSNADLGFHREELLRQRELYDQVVSTMREKILSDKKALAKFFAFAKEKVGSAKKYLVPKGLPKAKNVQPTLDELKVVGVISANEEQEFSFEDLIKQNESLIWDRIKEEI